MDFFTFLFGMASLIFNPVTLIPLSIIIILIMRNREYKKSTYFAETKHSYCAVRLNKGRYGEYLTYKYLRHMEDNGAKFLFNVYIPKENGDTTEIDVLMICAKGVFVFESKNYSGWIFGCENQKNWHQTLPAGRGKAHKEHFYNPVMQNRSHIKHLTAILGEQIKTWSIIVFSDRCTLKSVQITSDDVCVINRYDVARVVSSFYDKAPCDLLEANKISEIYNTLHPFTQVDETLKAQHIANIHRNLSGTPAQRPQSNATPSILKCPLCNGSLVLRTAAKGKNAGNKFYGCSNYPKCKYIQNVTNKTYY